MPIGKDVIRNRFGNHPSTPETQNLHDKVTEAYVLLGNYLDTILPDGRPKSSAITKLQESSMWAHFGVSELDSVVEPESISSSDDPTLF
jgi:hypothetical protein